MEKIYQSAPRFIQNLLLTCYNIKEYKIRYGKKYWKYRQIFKTNANLSLAELKLIQKKRYNTFLEKVTHQSNFYNKLYAKLNNTLEISDIDKLPVIDKETFRENLENIYTINKKNGIKSKTGGTTGKSLEVYFSKDNVQERFAMLDHFRSKFGYELGKKTAWFSGKGLLKNKDIYKNQFWKTDFYYNVRYYSTFHIKEEYLKYFVENLISYKPNYVIGFPSSILEIAKYGLRHKIDFPDNTIKAIFPTAETVTAETRTIIQRFFKSDIYDQYSSSEGAPSIFECENHQLHLELQSGVFEILNDNNEYSKSGRLIVTSFTTEATPLIRYDIGDNIELSDNTCNCGNNNPLVSKILGRIDDFIYSPENGKINLGNISNTLKNTKGVVKFQVVQNQLNSIIILLIIDKNYYDQNVEKEFLKNWRQRVGNKMNIELRFVSDIPLEASGKFRMVKNNIKNLLIN